MLDESKFLVTLYFPFFIFQIFMKIQVFYVSLHRIRQIDIMCKKTLILICILLSTNALLAQDTINVLFLGNSYTNVNNLPQLCASLAESSGKVMNTAANTPGGYLLTQHAVNTQSLKLIRDGKWNYVVLQEQSQLPSIDFYRHEFMHAGYQQLRDSVLLHNPDAQVVGYMTWGRRHGGQQCENYGLGLYCSADFRDFGHMQDSLTSAYDECRELFGGLTAPVGEAWRKALAESDIALHSSDDSHPTTEGSYLAACTFHALLWDESPAGLWHPAGMSEKTAAFLQRTATETVLEPSGLHETNDIDDDFQFFRSNGEIIITSKKETNAKVSVYDFYGNEIAKARFNGSNRCETNNCEINTPVIISIRDEDANNESRHKLLFK